MQIILAWCNYIGETTTMLLIDKGATVSFAIIDRLVSNGTATIMESSMGVPVGRCKPNARAFATDWELFFSELSLRYSVNI